MSSPNTPHARHDIIVVGGSRGSLTPLRLLLAHLPSSTRASLFVVQHRSTEAPAATDILRMNTAWSVEVARDGVVPALGTAYLAASDRHLLLANGVMRVVFGPRENLARPSIDVLFRSAAVEYGSRVIGVLLSGSMSDGVSGISAVGRCGGTTITQSEDDATDPELPSRASGAGVDHRARGDQLAGLIERLGHAPARPPLAIPPDLLMEARAAFRAMTAWTEVSEPGEPTEFKCPECDGPIRRIADGGIDRYRCHIGHAYSMQALLRGQSLELERALWISFRTLVERCRMLDKMIEDGRSRERGAYVKQYEQRRDELREHIEAVRRVLAAMDSPESAG